MSASPMEGSSIDQAPLKGKVRRDWEQSLLDQVKGFREAKDKKGEKRARVRAWNHTLLALFNWAQGKADCFPSKGAIADRLGVDPKTVSRNLKAMVEAGLIVVVEDGSIKQARRIVFPSHPNAGEVLKQFPNYMHRVQNVPCAPTCTGDKIDTCTGGISGRCMGGNIMPPESKSSETKRRETNNPASSPTSPQSAVRERGGGLVPFKKGSIQAEFLEECVGLLGEKCRDGATRDAAKYSDAALTTALLAMAGQDKVWSYKFVATCLRNHGDLREPREAEWYRQYTEAMAEGRPIPGWKHLGLPPQGICDLIDAWLDDHPEFEATLPPPQGSRDIDCRPGGGLCGECPACEKRDRRRPVALQRWFRRRPSLERLANEAIAFYGVTDTEARQDFYEEVYQCREHEAEMWGLLDWLKSRPRKPRSRHFDTLVHAVLAWERKHRIDSGASTGTIVDEGDGYTWAEGDDDIPF